MIHGYSFDEFLKLGEILAKSGLFDCSQPVQGQGILLFCEHSKLTLAEFRNKYHFANGLMQPRAATMLGDFIKNGGRHKWIKDGEDGKEATLELTDKNGNVTTASFTIEQAQKRGLVKKDSGWVKSPGEMLRARAITKAINMVDPGIGYIESDSSDEPAPLADKAEFKPTLLPDKEDIKAPELPEKKETKKVKLKDREKPEAEAKPEPEPAEKPQANLEPAPVEDKSNPDLMPTEKQDKPQLSNELVEQLAAALEGCEAAAGEYFLKHNWLQKGEGIACLKEPQARRILKNVDSFIKAIGGPF